MTDELLERLREHIGGAGEPPVTALLPVNSAMIRNWCHALGDTNPAYLDEERAMAGRRGAVIAPPAMLQTWCMDKPAGATAGGSLDTVLGLLTDAGFTSVVATNYDQDYARELRIGDVLAEEREIEDVSGPKRTALGEGYFVTMLNTYRDQTGEIVGTARMRVLRFRPAAAAATAQAGQPAADPRPRPAPPVNRDTAYFWEGTARGELLIQQCADCGQLQHPPTPMCPACRSVRRTAVRSSGRGTVHSYAVAHHPPIPGLAMPVTVLLVDLEEGVRMVADLAPEDAEEEEEVTVGMPVTVEFVTAGDLRLPRFRRSVAGDGR